MSRVKLSRFVFNQVEDSLSIAIEVSKEQEFGDYAVYYQKVEDEYTIYLNDTNQDYVFVENVDSRDEVKVVAEDYILTNTDLDEYMIIYDSFGLFE